MADQRRLTADRFYGGTSDRLELLEQFLSSIGDDSVDRAAATDWILSNTQARSREAIDRHLVFLDAVELIHIADDTVEVGTRGRQYLSSSEPSDIYEALRMNVKGFDTIVQRMQNGPITDEDIMDLLVAEFEDINMESPGVASS